MGIITGGVKHNFMYIFMYIQQHLIFSTFMDDHTNIGKNVLKL